MKPFMDEDFLLETESARSLFHEAAKDEPIYDFHCHLIPAQIAENKRFSNLTELWLAGDHYKWRMMRAMGFDEYYITGRSSDYEKFLAWARTVERLIGNPLYHWTHLELRRCFGIDEVLSGKTAPFIWEKSHALLAEGGLSVKDVFEKFKVYAVGTTDDPADSLEYHKAIGQGIAPIGKIKTKVIPSFRPDKALNIDKPGFVEYIDRLSSASGVAIRSVADLVRALEKRLDYFASLGCRASDHALEYPPCATADDADIEKTFQKALADGPVDMPDAYKTKVLTELARLYTERGIVMQLHFASIRNVNSRMFKLLGPDVGYDASHDHQATANLAGLLDRMESNGALPKTVLYTLNPKDYYPFVTVMGGFQDNSSKERAARGAACDGVRGKLQLGSAWWFCDHRDGMEEQLRVLANVGLLSAFVGMLTDSRSFLSYPRHEYFRRIFCNLLGRWVENGEYPPDMDMLSSIVKDVCFGNAEKYFG
ncbi:MAG: glucuronate isomerase [Treponema sp.]|jgi:glucuronate isomerase|nr:glucuronate isomerase [Treponema sp.]